MVFYSCEKCGKQFSQKGHYNKHMNKKLPCVNETVTIIFVLWIFVILKLLKNKEKEIKMIVVVAELI